MHLMGRAREASHKLQVYVAHIYLTKGHPKHCPEIWMGLGKANNGMITEEHETKYIKAFISTKPRKYLP